MESKNTSRVTGYEQAKKIDKAFDFSLKKKYRVLENLYVKLEQRQSKSNKGFQGIVWFFDLQYKMIKNLNSATQSELPINIAFTTTPVPKSLDKGYKKSTIKHTGDYVSQMQELYNVLSEFDRLQKNETERRQKYEKKLKKDILSKAESNFKNCNKFMKKSISAVNKARKKMLKHWTDWGTAMRVMETTYQVRTAGRDVSKQKDTFECFLDLYNKHILSHEELKTYAAVVIKCWRELSEFELDRAVLINKLFSNCV